VPKTPFLAALLCLGLALPASAAAPPPPPPWQPAVERLITQLGDPDHRRRDEAERRLRAEGVRVVPLLRKALGRPDAELRRRALRLIPILETEALLAPRRLTLAVTAKPLPAILAEISRQTGYKVQYYPASPVAEAYTCDFKDVTFWEAIDRLCREANLVVQTGYGDGQVGLQQADGHSPYVGRDGPFRYQANNFQLYRHVELGLVGGKSGAPPARSENLTFTFTLFAEPRLPFLGLGEVRLESAYDNEKNSMLVPRESPGMIEPGFGGRMWSRRYYGGGNRQLALQAQVNLHRPSEKATRVKEMRGVVPVTLLVEQKPLVVTDKVLSAKGKKVVAGDTQFSFDDVVKLPGNQYQLKLTITNQNKDNPGLHTWMNSLYQRIELQDDKGVRYQNWGTSWGGSGVNQVNWTLTYSAQGLGKVGPPTRFVYHQWVTRQHNITFEFKNLPLP
jgi:hypothetical protein